VLWHHASAGYIRIEETTEVPLMASIFLVMVWHVRRRQVASAEVARLAALDRARAEGEQMFVRLMSHEMRTPITVARGYTELLRSAHADEQQTLDDTAVVLDELNKLDRSTHRLVNLVIADPGDLEAVRLDELLDRVAHRWSPTAERRWRVECPDVLVRTDGERLETALDCLLENALTYTTDGDLVGLVGRMEPDAVVIEVTDSGGGIPATDLPYVFDPFRRGANSGIHPGTGLGLAIVRRTVEAWGGSVAAVSAEGSGTTFTLRLPLSPPPTVVPPTPWIADDTAIAPGRAPRPGPAA
jgi:signal transduction histidine kinase